MVKLPDSALLNGFVALIDLMMIFLTAMKKGKMKPDYRFLVLLCVALVELVLDTMSRVENPDASLALLRVNQVGDLGIYLLDPVLYLLALLYMQSWTVDRLRKKDILPYTALFLFILGNAVWVLTDFFGRYRQIFYYDANLEYQRGNLYSLRAILLLFFILGMGLTLIFEDFRDYKKYAGFILGFTVIIIVFGLLQVLFEGAGLQYPGTVLGCLLLYVGIQDRQINIDSLTGLLDRRGIEQILHSWMTRRPKGGRFAAYLLDIDFFKHINDDFGHDEGDHALRILALYLKESFPRHSAIGRYGGDEFLVLMPVKSDHDDLKAPLDQLQESCIRYNISNPGYTLAFSCGYALYDPKTDRNPDEFFHRLDRRMYAAKAEHHSLRS